MDKFSILASSYANNLKLVQLSLLKKNAQAQQKTVEILLESDNRMTSYSSNSKGVNVNISA